MKDLKVHKLGVYPIVKHYMDELGLLEIFMQYLPLVKGEAILSSCLCVLIANILQENRPLYKVSDWLGDYSDGQSEFGYYSNAYTDDRLGDSLDFLHKSDRNSMLSLISSKAISLHELNTDVVHNDTTTISFSGSYEEVEAGNINLTQGLNKDGKPNCKQIVFGLSTLADGHVPIYPKWYSGNVADSQTHTTNWNELKDFLQKTDFIYVADSKLATTESMTHLHSNGGHFISILPGTRKRVQDFKSSLCKENCSIEWESLVSYPNSRKKSEQIDYECYNGEKTKEGFPILWIRSSGKKAIDKAKRMAKIRKIEEKLKTLSPKLNKRKLKTIPQIIETIDKICGSSLEFFNIEIKENHELIEKKKGRGRIGRHTKYEVVVTTSYSLEWSRNEDVLKNKEKIDGIFPLVHNTDLPAIEVLKKYKEQPFLEKRFTTLKSILNVAPIWLNQPKRIEAMMFLFFIALMIVALIERQIAKNMEEQDVDKLPILPQRMNTRKPTWNNIQYFFQSLFFISQESVNQEFTYLTKGLSKLHQKVLSLLDVPIDLFQIKSVFWWKFQPN